MYISVHDVHNGGIEGLAETHLRLPGHGPEGSSVMGLELQRWHLTRDAHNQRLQPKIATALAA